jgi:hypothetical protein
VVEWHAVHWLKACGGPAGAAAEACGEGVPLGCADGVALGVGVALSAGDALASAVGTASGATVAASPGAASAGWSEAWLSEPHAARAMASEAAKAKREIIETASFELWSGAFLSRPPRCARGEIVARMPQDGVKARGGFRGLYPAPSRAPIRAGSEDLV